MSNGVVLLIIVVIVLIMAIYIVGAIIRKRNDVLLQKLESKREELFALPVNDELEDVKNMHLIGQSQTTFREWNQKWVDLSINSFADVEKHIFEAENLNSSFRFFTAKSVIESIDSQLKIIEKDIHDIREALSVLKEQEAKNSDRVKHLLDTFEELKTTAVDQMDDLGSAYPEIEKKLQAIETEFSQFVTLNTTGDPLEASTVLDRTEEHTIALKQITEKIPAIHEKLVEALPEQVADLEQGYQAMKEDDFVFLDSDLEDRFAVLKSDIESNEKKLASLELDTTISENNRIQESIDALYTMFNQEVKSRATFQKNRQILPEYIHHAKENNQRLRLELDRLAQFYVLDDLDTDFVASFHETVQSIEMAFQKMSEVNDSERLPYSSLDEQAQSLLEQLKSVEEKQVSVDHNLKKVETAAKKASQKANIYVNKLHNIKRYMEKRHLPGIPTEFLDKFFMTSSNVETLQNELEQSRINVENVKQALNVATMAISELEELTQATVEDAVLTEQLLQYSNRYRSFNETVQNSFVKAYDLFENDFAYHQSFEEIASALESIEPGVTDRFVNSYEKTKDAIRF